MNSNLILLVLKEEKVDTLIFCVYFISPNPLILQYSQWKIARFSCDMLSKEFLQGGSDVLLLLQGKKRREDSLER